MLSREAIANFLVNPSDRHPNHSLIRFPARPMPDNQPSPPFDLDLQMVWSDGDVAYEVRRELLERIEHSPIPVRGIFGLGREISATFLAGLAENLQIIGGIVHVTPKYADHFWMSVYTPDGEIDKPAPVAILVGMITDLDTVKETTKVLNSTGIFRATSVLSITDPEFPKIDLSLKEAGVLNHIALTGNSAIIQCPNFRKRFGTDAFKEA